MSLYYLPCQFLNASTAPSTQASDPLEVFREQHERSGDGGDGTLAALEMLLDARVAPTLPVMFQDFVNFVLEIFLGCHISSLSSDVSPCAFTGHAGTVVVCGRTATRRVAGLCQPRD